jgi:hypothetical protein
MPISFDWEFEEEQEKLRPPDDGGRGWTAPRWLRRGVLVALLGIVVAGGIALWVRSRLQAADKQEAQLRTAVELELRVLAQQDAELFRALQDPTNPEWGSQQVARYILPGAGGFPPAPGLTPADRGIEIREVHYFGRTGRVELLRWFVAPASSAAREPLPFHITWFYTQDDTGQWYHTAPPGDYWGIPHMWYGRRLTIRATETEARWIGPLADELAPLVSSACRSLDCPRGADYQLEFVADVSPQVQGNAWTLPPLYLTGLPQDDAAEGAWREAVKAWTLEALSQSQVVQRSVAPYATQLTR